MNEQQAKIWEAMGVGPIWISRDGFDPILGESADAPLQEKAAFREAEAPAASAAAPAPAGSSRMKFAESFRSSSRTAEAAKPMQPAAEECRGHTEFVLEEINKADWNKLKTMVSQCRACGMSATRQHAVFGQEASAPKFVLVGEGPGAEEDAQGLPFVGKSGQLLTAMLKTIGVERGRDVVILNAVKCRPPKNRNPERSELAACGAYLKRQLELIEPKLIFCMGAFAARSVLGLDDAASIKSRRGKVFEANIGASSAKVVVSYHPSYLLRQPEAKALAWEDLVFLRSTAASLGIELKPPYEK